jgi:hypothetical protein
MRLVRLALVLAMLFTAAIVTIRTQSYNAPPLPDDLTAAPACPYPCFLGIRPGVTTRGEALYILNKHPWVRAIYAPEEVSRIAISWDWNGAQPPWLNQRIPTLQIGGPRVVGIFVPTNLRLGEVWLALGRPQRTLFYKVYNARGVMILVSYQDDKLQFRSSIPCPLNSTELWNARQAMQQPARQTGSMLEVQPPYTWPRLNRQFCG